MASKGNTKEGDIEQEDPKSFEQLVIAPHKIKYSNPNHVKVNAKMYDYRCDIKLRVGSSNFKAHREVLMEASDYFSAMFSHDMREKEQDVIELLEMSPSGFSLLLDYFYHGHVTIDQDTIDSVLDAARFFQVEWVVEVCCDYLIHQLSVENYQTVLHLAEMYHLGDLRGDIFRFLGLNLVRLVNEVDFFLNFDRELLTRFLREDVFVDVDEEFILELVVNWVEAKPEEREECLLPLLGLVRFPLIDAESLPMIREDLVRSPEIADAVAEAKHYNNDIAAQSLFRGLRFQPRGARPSVVMFTFALDICAVTYFNPSTGTKVQEELSESGMGTDFDTTSIAKVGNFLYRTGGYNTAVCSSELVYRYSAQFRDWTELAPMSHPRVSHAMCSSADKLFVFGGINHTIEDLGEEDDILSSVEVYDVKDNSWTDLLDLPSGSYNQAAAFSGGSVYLSGGISTDPYDSVPMQSLWRLDLNQSSWHIMRDMLYTRQGHSMTAVDSKLYVFGGYTTSPERRGQIFKDIYSSEVYDIETNQWTEIRPVPETFGHVLRSVGYLDGRFFLFGGGALHSYYVDEDRYEYGDYYGLSVQKMALLDVAYPH